MEHRTTYKIVIEITDINVEHIAWMVRQTADMMGMAGEYGGREFLAQRFAEEVIRKVGGRVVHYTEECVLAVCHHCRTITIWKRTPSRGPVLAGTSGE